MTTVAAAVVVAAVASAEGSADNRAEHSADLEVAAADTTADNLDSAPHHVLFFQPPVDIFLCYYSSQISLDLEN